MWLSITELSAQPVGRPLPVSNLLRQPDLLSGLRVLTERPGRIRFGVLILRAGAYPLHAV